MAQFKHWWKSKLLERRLRRLDSKRQARRLSAVQALQASGDTRASEPLAAMLNDEDVQVQQAAAIALASFQDARALKPLVASLKSSSGFKAYRYPGEFKFSYPELIRALGELGSVAFEALVVLLGEPDWSKRRKDMFVRREAASMRCEAISALVRLKDKRAVEPLATLLDDSERKVSEEAAVALWELGDARGVKVLIKHCAGGSAHWTKLLKGTAGRLSRILESAATRFTEEDLRAIENLPDEVYIYIPGAHKDWGEEEALSFSHMRKLAREELARRELEV